MKGLRGHINMPMLLKAFGGIQTVYLCDQKTFHACYSIVVSYSITNSLEMQLRNETTQHVLNIASFPGLHAQLLSLAVRKAGHTLNLKPRYRKQPVSQQIFANLNRILY